MTERRAKKSESIEIRLTHESKQALMSKAALDGLSASDIVRRSIADYLHGGCGEHGQASRFWKHVAALGVAGAAMLFAYLVYSPATVDPHRSFKAAMARSAFAQGGLSERRRLAEEFAKEFAVQRVLIDADKPHAKEEAFRILDLDSDRQLSLAEYRHLMVVPEGASGRALFQSQDHDHDGRLSDDEFGLWWAKPSS